MRNVVSQDDEKSFCDAIFYFYRLASARNMLYQFKNLL